MGGATSMNIRFFIFSIVAGMVIGFAGVNVGEQPIKTFFLLLALCIAHELTQEKHNA
jgi:hypothetical protein